MKDNLETRYSHFFEAGAVKSECIKKSLEFRAVEAKEKCPCGGQTGGRDLGSKVKVFVNRFQVWRKNWVLEWQMLM